MHKLNFPETLYEQHFMFIYLDLNENTFHYYIEINVLNFFINYTMI